MSDIRQRVEAALRGAGLTDKPREFDSSIHSWRCEHPERYGQCTCFGGLVNDIVQAVAPEEGHSSVFAMNADNLAHQWVCSACGGVESYTLNDVEARWTHAEEHGLDVPQWWADRTKSLCWSCDEPAVDSGEGRYCSSCADYEGTCVNDHCLTCGATT